MALERRIFGTMALVGIGLVAVALVSSPSLRRAVRPAVREAIRRGIGLYDKARHAVSEFAEDLEDLVAEVRADMAAPPSGDTAATQGGDTGLNGASATDQTYAERKQ
jgi:hypothetical protein